MPGPLTAGALLIESAGLATGGIVAMAGPFEVLGDVVDWILPDPIEDMRDFLLEAADDWLPFTEGQGQIFGWDIPFLSHGDGYDYDIGDLFPFHGHVTKRWMNECTGLHSYMMMDGYIANERADGTYKVWKPKKPIVIFSSGNKDLRDLLRADRALAKESGKIKKMLTARGYQVARKPARKFKK